MNSPTMIEDLIFAIETQRSIYDAVIGRLSDKQCLHPNIVGFWSVKDVIAHVSWFEQQMEQMVTNHSMVGKDTELWGLPTDQRNAVLYARYKDMPLDEVKAMAKERYDRMLAAIKQLEDADVTDPGRYQDMPSDWVPGDIIAQNTWLHYADHLVVIRKEFGL